MCIRDRLSPNPAVDFINVSCYGGMQDNIEIFSADGRLITTIPALGANALRIDLSTFDPGLYIIKIVSPYNIVCGRFVKL
jgi:hypothetical protein